MSWNGKFKFKIEYATDSTLFTATAGEKELAKSGLSREEWILKALQGEIDRLQKGMTNKQTAERLQKDIAAREAAVRS